MKDLNYELFMTERDWAPIRRCSSTVMSRLYA
jgi:hypothetical protein